MTHVLIFAFFGAAFAVGFYCFWVSLRVEFARVPRLLPFQAGDPCPAMNVSGDVEIAIRRAHGSR